MFYLRFTGLRVDLSLSKSDILEHQIRQPTEHCKCNERSQDTKQGDIADVGEELLAVHVEP